MPLSNTRGGFRPSRKHETGPRPSAKPDGTSPAKKGRASTLRREHDWDASLSRCSNAPFFCTNFLHSLGIKEGLTSSSHQQHRTRRLRCQLLEGVNHSSLRKLGRGADCTTITNFVTWASWSVLAFRCRLNKYLHQVRQGHSTYLRAKRLTGLHAKWMRFQVTQISQQNMYLVCSRLWTRITLSHFRPLQMTPLDQV